MGMFGRGPSGSGKRQAAKLPPHPGPDADGVSRVIPKNVWDGPQGDFLREIGASPDDPHNLMPTQELIQARFDRKREEQEAFLAEVNEQMPEGVSVVPWAMIPWSIWSQQHAPFLLVVCELYPVGPWNTLLLPADEHSSLILNLPQHLRGSPPGLEDAANRVIGEIHEKLNEVHARTADALAEGTLSSMDEHAAAVKQASASVTGLAHALGAQTYGDEAYARHNEVFGAALGWTLAD